MCNFSPLLQDRNETHCVICEGSGNGEDGAYAGDDNNDDYSVTMSYAAKKSKYDNLNQNSEKVDFPRDRTSASKEVGRRILQGWQLLDSPCPSCMSPLMSESAGSLEVCVFCDPDGDLELDDDDDFRDDSSRGSVSITLDLPDDFDASDPEAMAKLVQSATKGMISRQSRSRERPSPTRDDSDPVGLPRSRSRQRSRSTNESRVMSSRNRLPPAASPIRSQQRTPYLPPRPQYKSTPPRLTPENRVSRSRSKPRSKSRSKSRSQSRSKSRSQSRTRPPVPMRPSSHVEVPVIDDDDTSFLTDDRSTASTTLGAIMKQIQTCEVQLNAPIDTSDAESFREGMTNRKQATALIEKLSAAANAVRSIEDM